MLDKLKRLFVVVEEGANTVQTTENTQEITKTTASTANTSSPSITISTAEASDNPDKKFIDLLLNAIEKNNMEGYDYLEYKQTLQSLSAMNMDDATKYNSALAMAKTMGVNQQNILASAEHYLSVLNTEQKKFEEAVIAQKAKLDQSETNGLSTIEQSITNKQKQVEQLLAEIEQEKTQLAAAEADIKASAQKIQDTVSNFKGAYQLVAGQIQSDIQLIKQHTK